MKALVIAAAALAAGSTPLPAGTWHQASDQTELVLESKVKLAPSGSWAGTSFGGSVGYGSATTTRVVIEPVPRRVARTMRLTIAGDGRFDWTAERRFADAKGCTRTVRQRRTGTAAIAGDAIAFAVRGGEETASGCGSDATTPVTPGVERFAAALAGGTMTLRGPGGVRWQFRR